ncbi:MAG: hypothetical protein ACSLFR_15555 [Solirubrobacteraceae bacterium]
MSAVAVVRDIERPSILFGPLAEPQPAAGPTLEQMMAGTWSELARRASAACPMCGGRLHARWGAGPSPVAGRCDDCGTELT